MSRRVVSSLLPALALLAWVSCTREVAHEPVYDFARSFAAAELRYEPTRVEFAASDDISAVLLEGWSWSERSEDGTEYRWSNRPVSTAVFYLAKRRDLEVAFRFQPFPSPSGQPQEIAVSLNGHEVETIGLGGGWSEKRVLLPMAASRVGDNRLEFRYAWTAAPAELGSSKDRRRLAVAWDWLSFGEREARPATADADSGLVVLPGGTRLDYFLDAVPGSRLSIPSIDLRGGTRLRLSAALDGEGEAVDSPLGEFADSARDVEFTLPRRAGPLRVRLEAASGSGADAAFAAVQGMTVLSPVAGGSERPARDRDLSLPEGRPNIVVYVIDALRAENLGAYGYGRPVSPRIDALASEGVLFENAQAQSSWTKAAVASIFTGLLPWRHGAAGDAARLASEAPNLTESLKALGYRTGGASSNGYVGPVYGFDRGFDRFAMTDRRFGRSQAVHDLALEWLDELEGDEPFFLYVHTIDPHAPYVPPKDLRERFAPRVEDPAAGSVERVRRLIKGDEPATEETIADLVALYDAEIAANDRELGRFLDELRRRDRYEETLIVLTADHGEEFYEHGGWTHRQSLYSEVLDVPLIVKMPGARYAGARVETPAQHADLLPTILELLGEPVPEGVDGESLLSFFPGADGSVRERPVVSHLAIAHGPFFSVIFGDWKLITSQVAGRPHPPELFHRSRDRAERENLAPVFPVMVGYLTSMVRAELARGAAEAEAEDAELDPETRRALEALGYLN